VCRSFACSRRSPSELYRYADGESPQKPFRICDGRCFSCVSGALSVKSRNPVQPARRSNRAVSPSVVAIRARFFWSSPASKFSWLSWR